ncbi:acetylornithine deacetylase [Streptomyces sp. NPDC087422]|uniref:acetylornithine deacetylase n=1 Tax=Streptomyces sp. NPDC087422 TaxID=3365786 RepID=UPI003819FDCE
MAPGIPVTCSSDELFSRTLRILADLVRFDTTSHKSNVSIISYVKDLLTSCGVDSQLHWNTRHDKASLIATAGRGGVRERGILWSAHTDVVPVDGQIWTSDPFTLRVTDKLAVGRGTADMKGFIACCLAILSAAAIDSLTRPITLVLTYDEEVGCVGARQLVPELRKRSEQAIGCIVGEPTGLTVVVGHKGKQNHRVRFTGEAKHAALAPEAANPITTASALAIHASSLNQRFRSQGPHDERFGIPYSWINLGRVEGGVKPNIVPAVCTMELEVRALPEQGCDDISSQLRLYADGTLLNQMQAHTASATIEWEQLSDTPWFAIDENHPFVEMVTATLSKPTPPEYVAFGTEAGLFWGHAGIPTVVWGPGSIAQAHAPNEAVSLDQLSTCLSSLQKLPLASTSQTSP